MMKAARSAPATVPTGVMRRTMMVAMKMMMMMMMMMMMVSMMMMVMMMMMVIPDWIPDCWPVGKCGRGGTLD